MSTPTPTHTAVQRDEILSRVRAAMSKHGLQSRTLADEIADAVLASLTCRTSGANGAINALKGTNHDA